MSWFARSIANTLMPDRRADELDATNSSSDRSLVATGNNAREEDATRGVKEDISELTQTLSRQFRGVASFLAPPPSSSISDATPFPGNVPADGSDSPSIAGLRSDLAEIGGRFRSGISRLSGSKAVSEISKIANTFLPFGPEQDEEEATVGEDKGFGSEYGTGAVGVTEEVMAFVRNISMHPETWLDFPLLPDDEESDDFDMSDAQQEHALAVERLAPRLAALRIELCPSHMSEGCFWKIYFVLVHPRLDKHDAQLLSTPQIVEARALLLQKLQRRTKAETERHEVETVYREIDVTALPSNQQVIQKRDMKEISPSKIKEAVISEPTTVVVTDKHLVETTEVEIIDKSVIEEAPRQKTKDHNEQSDVSKTIERVIEHDKSVIADELLRQTQKNKEDQSDVSKVSIEKFSEDEDGDDWLKEETGEMGATGCGSAVPYADEDVSFSDLEDDDGTATKPSKK